MHKRSGHVVALVGGPIRIPKVPSMIQEFSTCQELYKSINPNEAVALGAAVLAAILAGERSSLVLAPLLLDSTPLPMARRR